MAATDDSGHLSTDELFRRHAAFVARFLSRLGVPAAQLEDALQEVFLVAHHHGGYRPGLAKPTSYLANIALRAAARYRHRDGIARTRHSEAPIEHMASEHDDPARALQVREDLARLQLALQKLPEELCTTLLLVEMEGESCVSVAAGLGCPVGTIYWRLHQARKQVRTTLLAMDVAHSPRAPQAKRAQPARSWMFLLGSDSFKQSEASRLLELARDQPSAAMPLEALVARHHELIRTGAELPAWASSAAPYSASWLSVLGTGPIAVGVAGLAVAAATALSMFSSAHHASSRVARARATAVVAQPTMPLASDTPQVRATEAPAPEAAPALAKRDEPASRTTARAHAHTRASERERNLALPDEVEPTPAAEAISTIANRETRGAIAQAQAPRVAVQRPEPSANKSASAPQPEPQREDAQGRPARKTELPQPIDEATAKMGRVVSDAELAEMRDIARAERLLSGDPARALALTRAMQAGFPNSRFGEERSYLEVMALQELGRTGEVRDKARAFLRAYPAGLYSERVRKAIAGKGR